MFLQDLNIDDFNSKAGHIITSDLNNINNTSVRGLFVKAEILGALIHKLEA